MPCGPGLLAHEERDFAANDRSYRCTLRQAFSCRTCWLPLVLSIGILPLVAPDAIKRPKTPHAFAGKEPYEAAKLAIARLVEQIASASSRAGPGSSHFAPRALQQLRSAWRYEV
jgi:hypothetical protein